MERQYTRIDRVRNLLDDALKTIPDEEVKRCAYVHLYGVGLSAALLSMKRGFGRTVAELAEIAGMLHDYTKYVCNEDENHAHRSAQYAKELLAKTETFSEEDIDLIYRAIYYHSDKKEVHTPFDEILKDADAFQHALRNPTEDYFFQKSRFQAVRKELGF